MRNAIFFTVLLTAFSFAFAVRVSEIPQLWSPQEEVFTSGQPNEEGFEQLAEMGIKTVINVLPERNCDPREAEIVLSKNMAYRTVSFHLSNFRKETIEQFSAILKKAEKPVLIHCGTGNHVGGLWFAYRVLIQKAPLDEAVKEGRIIGMRKDLEDSLFDWVLQNRDEF